jgi:hypothetical protein
LTGGAAEGEEPLQSDAELVRIASQVLRYESGGEPVEACFDRSVGGKHVSCSRGCAGHLETDSSVLHVTTGPLQDGECRVPFIEVANVGPNPQFAEHPPTCDAQDHLLLEARLRAAPIKLAGDAPVGRAVHQVVGIEQVEVHSSGAGLPDP